MRGGCKIIVDLSERDNFMPCVCVAEVIIALELEKKSCCGVSGDVYQFSLSRVFDSRNEDGPMGRPCAIGENSKIDGTSHCERAKRSNGCP